ncbi:MAG TPA: hypothetical protein VMF10_04955 [Candidatus Aquilonibacter sp.]|nr:hypothetical protein [Candidatus Aquilonibacter sp.]
MNRERVGMIALGGFALVVALSAGLRARADDANASYLKIAPLEQYLMPDRNAEIALARSAAPDSISHDAEVLVLERHGYETAIKGKNGFVCLVERSWMAPFDDPEFLNPDQRLPLCLNPPAAQTHLPFTVKATALALAGASKTEMFNTLKAAFDNKELPLPARGSMCYMMSKQQYFGRKYGNADPHLMFWFPQSDNMSWGAGLAGSPVFVHQDSPDPITTFVISVGRWSDGTAAQ